MASDEQIQEKYMHLQMLAGTIKQIQQQLSLIDEQQGEMSRVLQGLDDLEKTQPGTKMLAPLAEGMFVRATISSTDPILINVGNNVVVDKTIPQARELLKAREGELTSHREQLSAQMNEIMQLAQGLQEELAKLITQ